MRIIKRNGEEQEFDAKKIEIAIAKANASVDKDFRIPENFIAPYTAQVVAQCENCGHTPSVQEVQNFVENVLMDSRHHEVARSYITYRFTHDEMRQHNTTDDKILSLIEYKNEEVKQENSNKNPQVVSVQRDYMAGEVSKDLTMRMLLPKDIREAHEAGLIHFHDADYYAQHMHNCFSDDTLFFVRSASGKAVIRAFKDFCDGDSVTVKDKDGIWREATVHKYEKQPMQKVAFTRTDSPLVMKIVVCTSDHRWILENGTNTGDVTTHLKVGDVLYHRKWTVFDISEFQNGELQDAWCVEEPVTHSFTLADDMVTGNCDLINLDDMLQNGTVISGTLVERPHRFSTACNIATQIIAQVASCQYGGQSISLTHLAKFVDVSRQAILKEVTKENEELSLKLSEYQINEMVERRLMKEVCAGIQTIQYQVITLMTTNGQAPFITVFMYLNEAGNDVTLKKDLALCIEEMLRQRYEGVKNEAGVWITPAFPKLIYVLEEDNIREGTPYFYLTKLAAKCTAKRMVPDYISEKKMKEYKLSKGEAKNNGDTYTCMGCRSFLTPDRSGNGWDNVAKAKNYEPGKPKYYGRFNAGVVTINLVDVGLSAHKDMDEFWRIFDERLELCHRALQCRHKRLRGTLSDVAPILWQYGALARLEKGETIDKLLFGGYSTLSLGYAGLYECCVAMTGKSHTDPEAKPFALAIMQHMNDKCNEWKAAEDIDYSLYGTPQPDSRGACAVKCNEKAA